LNQPGEQAFIQSAFGPIFACAVGGSRAPNSDTSSGWTWVTGEPFTAGMITWAADNPGCCTPNEFWLVLQHSGLHDSVQCGAWPSLTEWSADCNEDGVVDYGQIRSGQLADTDLDGVPDICEAPHCPGDVTGNGVVNGTDLAAILVARGTDGSSKFDCDIDDSGVVDGADLASVLVGWGACP
jgi:hypothetical protein